MSLGTVFYYTQTISPGQRSDSFHVGHLSEEVNRHDGARAGGDERFQAVAVDEEVIFSYVAEDGRQLGTAHGFDRGYKSISRHDHFVAVGPSL